MSLKFTITKPKQPNIITNNTITNNTNFWNRQQTLFAQLFYGLVKLYTRLVIINYAYAYGKYGNLSTAIWLNLKIS